jgi:HAMP domain-containing protein
MEMNGAEISAIAALSGSALGGLTPIVSNYLVQRGLTEREMLDRELGARQSLYSDFIQFATKIYVNATTKELEDADDLVALYALISRIRLIASTPVIEAAEEFAANVTKRYGEEAISFEVLKNTALSPHIDPLNVFSSRCRDELRSLLGHK